MLGTITNDTEWSNMLLESHENPVILYCWASWCIPCKTFKPQFIEFMEKHTEVICYLIDVDDLPDELLDFGVSSVPTVVRVESGVPVSTVNGPYLDKISEIV